MLVNGQLARRQEAGNVDRCRTVRPHPGPIIRASDVSKLPAELPGQVRSFACWSSNVPGAAGDEHVEPAAHGGVKETRRCSGQGAQPHEVMLSDALGDDA
jgi:hypothetical protein